MQQKSKKRDSFLELSAHNEYLETLYDYGIIVFVIYLYFIALLVKKCVCFYKSNSVFLIPYITSLCIFFSIFLNISSKLLCPEAVPPKVFNLLPNGLIQS